MVVRSVEFMDLNLSLVLTGLAMPAPYYLRDDLLIVQSVDFFLPLVDDPYVFGQIAAANSMSDISTRGVAARVTLNIVGLPDTELNLGILTTILQGGERLRKAA